MAVNSMTTCARFLSELKRLGDSQRVIRDQRYNKSSREHWGVRVPTCASLVRSFCASMTEGERLRFAEALWETNLFDPMICAAKVLSLPKLGPSRALWELIERFMPQVDGWALEDQLAPAAWKCLLADLSLLDVLESWTDHERFWMRRATLVYTLPFAKVRHDPERMLGWASRYASDPEWFIQKAIGWWLRVLGAHNPERVSIFLDAHWDQLKGVAKKEATRKLGSVWQKKRGAIE